jgi:uncharacterized protein YjcR
MTGPAPDPSAPLQGERFLDPRRLARSLYWRGWAIEQLVDELNTLHGLTLKAATVRSWKARDGWDEAPLVARCESCLETRYCTLVEKETKSGHDFKEIDLLGRQIERFARIGKYRETGREADLNPNILARNEAPKKKARKNYLTAEQVDAVKAAFSDGLFAYQLAWRAPIAMFAGSTALATRFILKSRQIGATFYFAREAFCRLLETGNNQIFISASRAQANVFRQYIVDFVFNACGVQLTGDPIILDLDEIAGPNGEAPKLYFLGTNYRTAQSYHGDVYIDECFWVHAFERIDEVASAMASHDRYRITYFSTPSTVAHQAHRVWSGEKFNADRAKADRAAFDMDPEALRRGVLGPDGIWRQVVTLLDARAGGCELMSEQRLRLRYPPDVFDNLYMCRFVDDSQSMFPFALMRGCMVDSWDAWAEDFDPYALRPFGDREVWIGYDPAESAAGDDAALVILAAPRSPKDKIRVLEKYRLKGLDFQAQADKIIEQLDRYNVSYIGIDTTGVGASVWQLVTKRFPTARRIDYSVPVKTQMVLKAKSVMMAKRLEFDSGALDIANSFMAIRAELTGSQRQVTYVASRAGDTGHADLAWAIMHALAAEPLDPGDSHSRKTRVRSFGHGNPGGVAGAGGRDGADRRDEQRPGDPGVPVRRHRAGARSARPDQLRRVHVERAVVRAADPDARSRARLPCQPASFERDHLQARPARPPFQAVAAARSPQLRRHGVQLPDDRQRLSRAA